MERASLARPIEETTDDWQTDVFQTHGLGAIENQIRCRPHRPRKRGSAPGGRSILVGQIQIIGLRFSNLLVWPIEWNRRRLTG